MLPAFVIVFKFMRGLCSNACRNWFACQATCLTFLRSAVGWYAMRE